MKAARILAASLALLGANALASVDVSFTGPARELAERKVLVEPAMVRFHRDFLEEVRTFGPRRNGLTRAEADRLARDMGESFHRALSEALRAHGFQVVTAPGADVLRMAPAVEQLYIHAPDDSRPGVRRTYVREAGSAAMRVELRDARGEPLAVATDETTTGRSDERSQASSPTRASTGNHR